MQTEILKDMKDLRSHYESELRKLEKAIMALEGETKPRVRRQKSERPAQQEVSALVLDVDVISNLIERHGPITVEQLTELTGCTERQAKKELKFHAKYGSLTENDGKYSVAKVPEAE